MNGDKDFPEDTERMDGAGGNNDMVDEGPAEEPEIADELAAEQEAQDEGADVHTTEASAVGAVHKLASALEEQRERYLRLAAEFENFRRRTSKERLEMSERAQAELAAALLDTLDDLGRFASVDAGSTDATTLVDGVTLVNRKLMKVLSQAGLEVVNPVDESFDPAVHEAIATQPAVAAEDDDMVGQVYQLGYRFKGQLLRPARVVVLKHQS